MGKADSEGALRGCDREVLGAGKSEKNSKFHLQQKATINTLEESFICFNSL